MSDCGLAFHAQCSLEISEGAFISKNISEYQLLKLFYAGSMLLSKSKL